MWGGIPSDPPWQAFGTAGVFLSASAAAGKGLPRGRRWSVVENPLGNAGDLRDAGSIPWPGRSPGEGNGNSL